MKTHQIEIQRLKSLTQNKGLFELRVDALVLPSPKPRDDEEPSTFLLLDEKDARSLLLLLKAQFAEMEKKNKGRSQR